MSKDFAPTFVKSERYSSTLFTTLTNNEHIFQSELTDFANALFFKDQINLFECYNGLAKAHQENPRLGLDSALKHLENTYGEALRRNDQFREIDSAINEAISASRSAKQIGGI